MYKQLVLNDIKKNRLISATITMFICLAVLLTSLAAGLAVNLVTAIDQSMELAQTPHLMQMHSGEVNYERLQKFAKEQANVQAVQTSPFLNLEGSEITIGEHTLKDSIQDNGVTIQSKDFDYLLDVEGQIIQPKKGEVYVPLYYLKEGQAKLGDQLSIHGIPFKIAGFLRDSQMNAALISSKRFLLHPADYQQLETFGRLETLILFRLKDSSKVADLENAYAAAGLESNGPPSVSYQNFKLANAITDGLMIGVLVIISLLVILVTFLCIRFTLLAKIEEDYQEIGVLKAIGIRVSVIRNIYLAKYGVLSLFAGILGFVGALVLQQSLMKNIRLYFGESNNVMLSIVFSLLGAILIVSIILLYTNGLMRRFRKLSAAQAIRFGAPKERTGKSKRFTLSKNHFFSTDVFLGIKDVLVRKKLYLTMLVVVIISAFLMILPRNLHTTISSKNFMTYMGIGRCDSLIYLQQTDNIPEKTKQIATDLAKDQTVEHYAVLTSYMFEVAMPDQTTQRLKVELGDHRQFPVAYGKGTAPQSKAQIALSNMVADDLEKKVGDTLELLVAGKKRTLTVSGIYSDVTNGGKTTKATFEPPEENAHVIGSSIPVTFKKAEMIDQQTEEFKQRYEYASVADIDEHIQQTLGGTIAGIQTASLIAILITVFLIFLVTILFMKLLVAKDRFSTAILKAIGFENRSIRRQYLARSGVILILGVVSGTLLANTLGEYVSVALISSFGLSSIQFEVNPFFAYLIAPLVIAAAIYTATIIGTKDIVEITIPEHIKE